MTAYHHAIADFPPSLIHVTDRYFRRRPWRTDWVTKAQAWLDIAADIYDLPAITLSHTTAAGASGMALLDAGSIELKGKSEIVPIHILIGDESIAGSAEFVRLANAHANLVEALRTGAAGWENRIQTCRDLARPVHQELAGFYDLVAARRSDFRSRSNVVDPVAVSVGAGRS